MTSRENKPAFIALDATMEARFGENFGSGHSRVQSLMKEIRDAVKAGK